MRSDEDLRKYNIIRKGTGCSCGISQGTTRYSLPFRLNNQILSFISPIGEPCFDFDKIGFLKIETPNFCLSGLRNTFYVSFHQKKPCPELLDKLEEILILYVSNS